jgi:hypothetical protein
MLLLRSMRRSRTCTCGHQPEAHQHYRPGSDCGMCECPQWSRCGGSRLALAFRRTCDTPDEGLIGGQAGSGSWAWPVTGISTVESAATVTTGDPLLPLDQPDTQTTSAAVQP